MYLLVVGKVVVTSRSDHTQLLKHIHNNNKITKKVLPQHNRTDFEIVKTQHTFYTFTRQIVAAQAQAGHVSEATNGRRHAASQAVEVQV